MGSEEDDMAADADADCSENLACRRRQAQYGSSASKQASKLYEYSGQQAKQDHLCLLLGTAVCRSIVRGNEKGRSDAALLIDGRWYRYSSENAKGSSGQATSKEVPSDDGDGQNQPMRGRAVVVTKAKRMTSYSSTKRESRKPHVSMQSFSEVNHRVVEYNSAP